MGERESARVRSLVSEIFGEAPLPGVPHACGRGRGVFVAEDREAGPALTTTISPCVRMSPRPGSVGFLHRRAAGRDIFFFVNVGPDETRFIADFPEPARPIEKWDAMTGEIQPVAPEAAQIEINLPPRGSIFIVVGGQSPGLSAPASQISTSLIETRELKIDWALTFEGPDAPPSTQLANLVSWTDLAGGRDFSGTGIYRGRFEWEGKLPIKAVLSFDEIREAAEVRLNGRSLGVLFNPPLEIEATSALRAGVNELEIIVVNLPLNRFLGLPDQDLGPLQARFGNRFPAPQEKKTPGVPAPAGLIGKMRLIVYGPRLASPGPIFLTEKRILQRGYRIF
jgi:hypothetical protein